MTFLFFCTYLYRMMSRLCCLGCFILLSLRLFPQSDTIALPEVIVTESRLNLSSLGSQKQAFDREFLAKNQVRNLSDLAKTHTALFVNAYGPGLLNSPSSRGSGSGHTAILWNGFNIQNSMNGVVDFSLVPLSNFGQISIHYGGAGALYGSGAVGGTIYLNSQKKMQNGWHGNISSSAGSFGSFRQNGQIRFGTKGVVSALSLYHTVADNDFNYVYKGQKGKQQNSAFQQTGIHQDNSFQIADNQLLRTFVWYQKSEREIAPSATEGESDAFQEDRALRAGLEWSLFKNKTTFKARSAYFDEYLSFESSLVDQSESYTKAIITELEARHTFSSAMSLNVGLHHTFDQASSTAFEDLKTRNRAAVFTSLKAAFWRQKGQLVASLRQEIVDQKRVPLMPSLGTRIQLSEAFQWQAKIAGMYKLPNFNDLYWPEVGEPDLLPESGWTAETGGIFRMNNFQVNGTVFHSLIDDWILWAPVNGVWRPSNQRAVWSRGFSGKVSLHKSFGQLQGEAVLAYEYTRSTIRKSDQTDPQLSGKQLIYVPLHQFKSVFNVKFQDYRLSYYHLITGKRFTATDNSQSVGAYQTGDFSLSRLVRLKTSRLRIGAAINNLWNQNYVILPARPMPGRNYGLDLSFEF